MSGTVTPLKQRSVREQVSAEEWAARVDLAACYRLVARMGWTDLIYTHISARVPGPEHHFLINPYGLMFDEVTASNLVKVDLDGQIVMETPYSFNPAGFTIHSAVHAAREDALCVLHTHTAAGMAVAAQVKGLLPISQHAMRFHDRISYHDYEGIALDLDERERLVGDLGTTYAMILRNHGLLTCGRSVAEAFTIMFYLQKACEAQVAALAGGGELKLVPDDVAEHAAQQFERGGEKSSNRPWQALLRTLEREDTSYRE
ncbi:MAG: class II aldolase/adducin family protein [Alphaproteobacteria bacterium]|nr:class II aldolase/adducin family protein [Alphaproteobacteria bacterium]MBU0797666.1 class II aldolase/adducin family protein [Alphaproteobacteria bacterium]MBU0888001.1 class II aldolase/adducin family protein [Alphaproteobacteria bacterium]MBU1811678.1 class II aldolase/adducin family protein [Alphaproteobacteria bacterium]